MGFEYVSVEDAMARDGLRMIVVAGVPSPWGEAAKGIFHIKGLDWAGVHLDHKNEQIKKWAGQRSGPVVFHNDDRPRTGWVEILLLAERLAPTPSLLPQDPATRALMFGLCHELLGEQGLAWTRRLQLIHAGLNGEVGFPAPVAAYLGKKYGYQPEAAGGFGSRIVELLNLLTNQLRQQKEAGHSYYMTDKLTALDVYSATVLALLKPLPPEQCAMNPYSRKAFESLDAEVEAAIDPLLLAHRDMMYEKHLALPLSL